MKRNTITGFLHGTQTFVIDSSLTFHQLLNLVASVTDLSMSEDSTKKAEEPYRYKGMMGEDSFRVEKTDPAAFYQHDLAIDGQIKDSKLGYELHLTFSMKRQTLASFFAVGLVFCLPLLWAGSFFDTDYVITCLALTAIITALNWHDVWRQGKKEADFLRQQIEKLENAPMLESSVETDNFFVSQNAPQAQELFSKRE